MLQNFECAYNQAIDCKLNGSFLEIEHCLKMKPLKIEVCDFKNFKHKIILYDTDFQEIYKGTGVVVAYILYNKLVAFHYDFEKPKNIPTYCQEERCFVRNYTIYLKNYIHDIYLDRKNMIKEVLNLE